MEINKQELDNWITREPEQDSRCEQCRFGDGCDGDACRLNDVETGIREGRLSMAKEIIEWVKENSEWRSHGFGISHKPDAIEINYPASEAKCKEWLK